MRKKLYKSGKMWVAASVAISFSALSISVGNNGAKADDSQQSSTQIQSTQVTTALPAGGQYSTTNGGQSWNYLVNGVAIKGMYQDGQGQLRYFNFIDGTQVKGEFLSINGTYYYFDQNSGEGHLVPTQSNGHYTEIGNTGAWGYQNSNGELVKGIQNIDGQLRYFDENTGNQVKGGSATIGNKSYYFEPSQGTLTTTIDQVSDAQNANIRGLATVNGQLNYFDPTTGEQAKHKQVATNGATYYFNDSGVGTYLFTNVQNTPANDVSQHNAVNSTDTKDYTNTVDGFLTADTWYRPKYILDNGENWRASNEGEYRPFIMNWWPNKNVEVNYLKLMQNNNLLSSTVQYDLFTDQAILNQAAYQAQIAIEKRIKSEGSTDWLNTLLFGGDDSHPSFVKQQFIWNSDSESPWQGDAWFQGGYLKYGNSVMTPTSNSNYRQAGNAFDFLLANDVDNQNPIVQAEDLNWLYYLMNFGSITTNGLDNDSNFDSIRLDAVDFIHNDAIQRTYDYLRQAFNLTKNEATANQHLSLVEAGVDAGTTTYNSDGLIESNIRPLATDSLTNAPGKNASLSNLIKDVDSGEVIADHANFSTDDGIPNYSIIHAHDKGIQENVGAAITAATGADWTNFTTEQLEQGLDLYYQDQRSTNKKYNIYNLPSIYALMLTNKGTVPRVYYGDMYQDNGQYMQQKSLYYDAISSLMTARKQYVAGGQTMSVDENGLLKSVRFGKNAMTAQDTGDAETRTEGVGVIIGNDPSVKVADGQTVTLDMGAAHKNQAYRPLILTTSDGIQTYDSDENAPVVYTDDNGILTFSNQDINGQANTKIVGTLNPQVSGYLAVWVPVGASADQDARTAPSTQSTNDGKVLHTGAALDSNLIFEGFSNFQPMPTTHDEMTNVVISQNASQFAKWGITSFEMAPQYRSSEDHSFLDSTIDNGYAFSDRYDLGFGTPTKYGTDEDLRNAIKALHQNGMQVMADVVMNQLYSLNGKEVVSASRAGVYGNDVDLPFGTQLYVVNTTGGGEYQKKYGGAFLNIIKEKYPTLFDSESYDYYLKNYSDNGHGPAYMTTATATREAIPSDQPLKEWSAKYMNGTNILGLGMGYVLKDWNNGAYFKLSGTDTTLPQSLVALTGWNQNDDGTWSYYSTDTDDRVTGKQVIDGRTLLFDNQGNQIKGGWGENPDGTWSYYNADTGDRVIGEQVIDGRTLFFDNQGVQVKGGWGENYDGTWSYYNADTGDRVTGKQVIDGRTLLFDNRGVQVKGGWGENSDGTWSYYNADTGDRVTGNQLIGGRNLLFDNQGNQIKGGWDENPDGTWSYYNADTGDRVTGVQVIDGKQLLFDSNGIQVKNSWQKNANGTWSYYDANDGHLVPANSSNDGTSSSTQDSGNKSNQNPSSSSNAVNKTTGWIKNSDGTWSYLSAKSGQKVTGSQTIDGKQLLFDDHGVQIKGGWGKNADGTWSYYDANSGELTSTSDMSNVNPQQTTTTTNEQSTTNQPTDITKNSDGVYVYKNDSNKKAQGYLNDGSSWKWFNDGQLYTGFQNYMGAYYYFINGIRQQNQWENIWGLKYYVGDDGRTVEGIHAIDGHAYDFGTDGTFNVKGSASGYLNDGKSWMWYEGGNPYTGFRYYMDTYYWFENGVRQDNAWHQAWGLTYYTGADGRAVQGVQNINGKLYYFGNDGTFFMRTNQEV
ncbi:glycoside hydrolase family 70 protein, partial [Fructobacillus tropaeoli]